MCKDPVSQQLVEQWVTELVVFGELNLVRDGHAHCSQTSVCAGAMQFLEWPPFWRDTQAIATSLADKLNRSCQRLNRGSQVALCL